MESRAAHCPACERYVGAFSSTCPYCDVDLPSSRGYRFFRRAAWMLATVGLLLLWRATLQSSTPTWPIAELTPALHFARLHITGQLTQTPRVSSNRRSASTEVEDGSGQTLRVVFLEEALQALLARDPRPQKGAPIRVQGQLHIQRQTQPVMFLRTAAQFNILEPSP